MAKQLSEIRNAEVGKVASLERKMHNQNQRLQSAKVEDWHKKQQKKNELRLAEAARTERRHSVDYFLHKVKGDELK